MESILTARQRGYLVVAALVCFLVLDGHGLRTMLSARQKLDEQRRAQIAIVTRVLEREIQLLPTFFGSAQAIRMRETASPILTQLAGRYGFPSTQIIGSTGLLVAASHGGHALTTAAPFARLPADRRRLLLEQEGVPQYSLPWSAGESEGRFIDVFVPFTVPGVGRHVLAVVMRDEGGAQEAQLSRDILIYQSLGVGATIVLVTLVLLWALRPYRRARRAAAAAVTPSAADDLRGGDEKTMMVASFQGVIAGLREREKELRESSRLDRERAETASRLSTDMLQQMEAAVLQFSSQGRVTQCNRAATQLFAATALILHNQHCTRLFEGNPAWRELIEGAIQRGAREQDRVLPHRTPDGRELIYRVSVTPVAEPDGRQGALCVMSDVTERSRLEQLLADREKLAALGEMAGGLAHEVRNSLGTLLGLLRLLPPPRAGADSDEAARFHGMMQKEIQELSRVVTDFLDFTRPLTMRLEAVDTRQTLERCIEEVLVKLPERARDVSIEGEFATVNGDETLLYQAFSNLIRNGLESGGETRLTISGARDSSDLTERIEFRDSGPGIAPEHLDKIFIPFYTTKETGYGMGLALVKKIILAHSGQIEVASEPGRGTVFLVTLPSASAAPASSAAVK